jgi:hypothetical protein
MMDSMPVTVKVKGAGRPQYPPHLHDTLAHPFDVVIDAALPPILKAPDFGFVAPDNLIVPVAEEWGIEINEVNRARGQDG